MKFKIKSLLLAAVALFILDCNATKTQTGAVIGASVGGTAGAITGHDMDKQASEIKTELPGAKVERVAEGIKVEFNEKIPFAFSKSDLSDSAKINRDH